MKLGKRQRSRKRGRIEASLISIFSDPIAFHLFNATLSVTIKRTRTMSSVGSVGEGFFRRILLMVDLGDENPRHTTRVKRCASGRQSGDERVACIDRSFVRFHDTDYRLATRQETVSGLRPPPIFVEEEIGMKPQPQRCSLSRTVAVIARQTRRS